MDDNNTIADQPDKIENPEGGKNKEEFIQGGVRAEEEEGNAQNSK